MYISDSEDSITAFLAILSQLYYEFKSNDMLVSFTIRIEF